MKLRVALFLLCGAVLFAGRADAQVSVQVVPDNGSHPHPTARLANTSGHTVTFTVINNGTIDTRYAISCSRTGSVTSVSCSPTSPLIAECDSRVITATFAVGSAGTGRITLTATATQPTGASAVGGWDITVANPAASVTRCSICRKLAHETSGGRKPGPRCTDGSQLVAANGWAGDGNGWWGFDVKRLKSEPWHGGYITLRGGIHASRSSRSGHLLRERTCRSPDTAGRHADYSWHYAGTPVEI